MYEYDPTRRTRKTGSWGGGKNCMGFNEEYGEALARHAAGCILSFLKRLVRQREKYQTPRHQNYLLVHYAPPPAAVFAAMAPIDEQDTTNKLTEVMVTLRSSWLGDCSSRPWTWMLDPLSVEILRMVWPPFPMMEPTTELSTSMSMPPGCLDALVRPGAWSWRMDVNWTERGDGGR